MSVDEYEGCTTCKTQQVFSGNRQQLSVEEMKKIHDTALLCLSRIPLVLSGYEMANLLQCLYDTKDSGDWYSQVVDKIENELNYHNITIFDSSWYLTLKNIYSIHCINRLPLILNYHELANVLMVVRTANAGGDWYHQILNKIDDELRYHRFCLDENFDMSGENKSQYNGFFPDVHYMHVFDYHPNIPYPVGFRTRLVGPRRITINGQPHE